MMSYVVLFQKKPWCRADHSFREGFHVPLWSKKTMNVSQILKSFPDSRDTVRLDGACHVKVHTKIQVKLSKREKETVMVEEKSVPYVVL